MNSAAPIVQAPSNGHAEPADPSTAERTRAVALQAHLKNFARMVDGALSGEAPETTRAALDPIGVAEQLADYMSYALDDVRGPAKDTPEARAEAEQWRPKTREELVERKEALKSAKRIPLGIAPIDKLIGGGVLPGWMVLIGAYTGHGKTRLKVGMAIRAALRGHPVLYVTLELGEEEIDLLVDGAATNPLSDFQTWRVVAPPSRDWLPIRTCVEQWLKSVDSPELPPMVFIDYLGKIRGDLRAAGTREREVSMIVDDLQAIARRTGAIFVISAQFNRQTPNAPKPRLDHFRESGSIEQIADVALLLWKRAPDQLNVEAAKVRFGEAGREILLQADYAHCDFTPLPEQNLYDELVGPVLELLEESETKGRAKVRKISREVKFRGRGVTKTQLKRAGELLGNWRIEGSEVIRAEGPQPDITAVAGKESA